ncbi:hypothetical protein AB0L00_29950 [Actinoallomurus sp. NPDC052308]|uniref:hypothetical protein n=1 Tax=Actinoallomurus sp. NPDC052308 TaxID=3155530 RepID=UPI003436825C
MPGVVGARNRSPALTNDPGRVGRLEAVPDGQGDRFGLLGGQGAQRGQRLVTGDDMVGGVPGAQVRVGGQAGQPVDQAARLTGGAVGLAGQVPGDGQEPRQRLLGNLSILRHAIVNTSLVTSSAAWAGTRSTT